MTRAHPGFVYVVQLGDQPLVKIGWSRDPAARVRQLQGGSGGLPMKLLGCFVGSLQAEASLHAHFAALRPPGGREWFRLEGPLVAWLEAMGLAGVNPDPPLWSFAAPAADPPAAVPIIPPERHVEAWFAERVVDAPGVKVLAGHLWADFRTWCEGRGLHPIPSQRVFGGALQARGLSRAGKDADGRVLRLGGRLREGGNSE